MDSTLGITDLILIKVSVTKFKLGWGEARGMGKPHQN